MATRDVSSIVKIVIIAGLAEWVSVLDCEPMRCRFESLSHNRSIDTYGRVEAVETLRFYVCMLY